MGAARVRVRAPGIARRPPGAQRHLGPGAGPGAAEDGGRGAALRGRDVRRAGDRRRGLTRRLTWWSPRNETGPRLNEPDLLPSIASTTGVHRSVIDPDSVGGH